MSALLAMEQGSGLGSELLSLCGLLVPYLTTENPKLLPIINFFSEILEVWFKCITMKERNLGTGKGLRREEIHHHVLCVYCVSGTMLSDFHPFSHFSLTTTP